VTAGTFVFTLVGDLSEDIGDAVPDALSVVCTDANDSNTCEDDAIADQVPLSDANSDVGPVTLEAEEPVLARRAYLPLVSRD
jgi:hypothetical protein